MILGGGAFYGGQEGLFVDGGNYDFTQTTAFHSRCVRKVGQRSAPECAGGLGQKASSLRFLSKGSVM